MFSNLKGAYFSSVLRQEKAWHDSQDSSIHLNRLSSVLPKVKVIYGVQGSMVIVFVGKSLLSLIFALWADAKLAATAMSLFPAIALFFWAFSRLSSRTSAKQSQAYARAAAVAAEDLGLLRTIWTFCTQHRELQR
jgi:ATP-binding cassette subfamily B (MDR/TAP) protein 1